VRGSFESFVTVCSWQVSPLCGCHLKFYFSLALVNQNPTHNLCAGLYLLFLDCEFGAGLSSVLPPEVFGFVGSHQSKSHAQFMCRVILKFVYFVFEADLSSMFPLEVSFFVGSCQSKSHA